MLLSHLRRSTILLAVTVSRSFRFSIMAESSALKQAGINKDPKEVSNEEWRKILPPEQYYVTREAGTERPHSGKWVKTMKDGTYTCACCGASLFSSDAKFEAHCGWPSFTEALQQATADQTDNIVRRTDNSHGMARTEVVCKQCGAHLGHVFDDGPKPTGERFCINSISLDFVPKAKDE